MNEKMLTGMSYVGFFLIGVIGLVFAPALPLIINEFGLSLAAAGAIFPARAAGSFAGALLGGVLSDVLGRKPLVIGGCILQAVCMAAIAWTNNWLLVLLLFVITGLGGGFLNTSLNALIAEVNVNRRGAAMNTLHGVYGVGSLVGPVVVGLVLSTDISWRMLFIAVACIWTLYLLANLPLQFPASPGKESGKTGHKVAAGMKTILLHPIFLMLFLVSFLYNGSATGLVGWINTYLNQRQFPLILGASMVSVFYLGLTLGRFVCRHFSDGIGFARVIGICALGSFLTYPIAVFTPHPLSIAMGVFATGLFFSGLHPTGLAWANSLFPEFAGTISGVMSTAMSLGAMSIPWLVGIVADTFGLQTGMGIGFFALVFLLIVAYRLHVLSHRSDQALPV